MELYKKRLDKLFEWKKVPGYQVEVTRFGDVRDSITKKNKNIHVSCGYDHCSCKINE